LLLYTAQYLEEDLEVVDALNGQLEVLAQWFRVPDPLAVLLLIARAKQQSSR